MLNKISPGIADNHLNLFMASNQPNSIRVEANDRRFNVCPRQENKLLREDESGEEFIAKIQTELPEFADYLMTREADPGKARRALENDAKRRLQSVTQTAIEEVAQALLLGDLDYFFTSRSPSNPLWQEFVNFDSARINLTMAYIVILFDNQTSSCSQSLGGAEVGTTSVWMSY